MDVVSGFKIWEKGFGELPQLRVEEGRVVCNNKGASAKVAGDGVGHIWYGPEGDCLVSACGRMQTNNRLGEARFPARCSMNRFPGAKIQSHPACPRITTNPWVLRSGLISDTLAGVHFQCYMDGSSS